jgi:hypothetical protein
MQRPVLLLAVGRAPGRPSWYDVAGATVKRSRRKTAPRVIDGVVQFKNRRAPTPNYYNTPQTVPVIDRERPGPGYRHVLKKRDVIDFISILPDWDELSKELNVIALAAGEEDTDGWHHPGVVAVCAWERELWREMDAEFHEEHADLLERLGVPCETTRIGLLCKFSEPTAKAYQLLHVLLHELGHHHDRMTTRSKRAASRGEGYAERYARQYEKLIWGRYLEVFGLE